MKIMTGDALEKLKLLPDESVHCCVTSPPYYGLRDYGIDNQLGLEGTPLIYVERMVNIFHQVKRVLRSDGTLWLNLGDCYAGSGGMGSWVDDKAKKGMTIIKDYNRNKPIQGFKPKDLMGIPWRVAFALQNDGWYLRQDIIWHKPNPMPESVTDRCTKSHEYIFLLSKSKKYFYNTKAVMEEAKYDGRKDTFMKGSPKYSDGFTPVQSGRTIHERGHERWPNTKNGVRMKNRRDVWHIATRSYPDAHFATFPPELPELCIKAGCPEGGVVLDPFSGAGTSGMVALRFNRDYIGIELNPEYVEISKKRIYNDAPMFNGNNT
jgi:DNA modification methylase